jgi:hypothetical protein
MIRLPPCIPEIKDGLAGFEWADASPDERKKEQKRKWNRAARRAKRLRKRRLWIAAHSADGSKPAPQTVRIEPQRHQS